MNSRCEVCNNNSGKIKHHTSYLPQKIINVCERCHKKIHCSNNFLDLKPSRRMAKIFYSAKNCMRDSRGFVLRKLTNFELKIKRSMYG